MCICVSQFLGYDIESKCSPLFGKFFPTNVCACSVFGCVCVCTYNVCTVCAYYSWEEKNVQIHLHECVFTCVLNAEHISLWRMVCKIWPNGKWNTAPEKKKSVHHTPLLHIHNNDYETTTATTTCAGNSSKRPWKQKSRTRRKETKTREKERERKRREEVCSANSQNHTEWQEIDVDIVANYDETPKRWYYTNM